MHLPIFASTPDWSASGVNVVLRQLIRHVHARGGAARLVMAGQRQPSDAPFPPGLPDEEIGISATMPPLVQWRPLSRFLTRQAPCIYLPGYDWFCAYRSATLPAAMRMLFKARVPAACLMWILADWSTCGGVFVRRVVTGCDWLGNKKRPSCIHWMRQTSCEDSVKADAFAKGY